MRHQLNLFSLPNRTTLIFGLILLLCLGIFVPALPTSAPALGFVLLIIPFATNHWLNSYARARRTWQPRDLAVTHPLLTQQIRAIATQMGLSPRLQLWCTSDSRALIHVVGTLRRHALVIWDTLADDMQVAYTLPDQTGDSTIDGAVYRRLIQDQQLAELQTFWARYVQAPVYSLLRYEQRYRQQWHPQPLADSHPDLAAHLSRVAQRASIVPELEVWCIDQPFSMLHTFRTLRRAVLVLPRTLADEWEQPIVAAAIPMATMQQQEAAAILHHELAHLCNGDVPLVSLAHSLTVTLAWIAGFYLVTNATTAFLFLHIPTALDTIMRIAQEQYPWLPEGSGLTVSEHAYRVTWNVAGSQHEGIGLAQDDLLAVTTNECSVAIYHRSSDGRWSGTWTGSQRLGQEHLTPLVGEEAQVASTYQIHGNDPDGARYTGMLTIEQHRDVYHLTWLIGDNTFYGVGLVWDAVLVSGWSRQPTCGVAAYRQLPDGTLIGRQAAYGTAHSGSMQAVPQAFSPTVER